MTFLPVFIIIIIGLAFQFTRSKWIVKFSMPTKWSFISLTVYASILLLATVVVSVMDDRITAPPLEKISEDELFKVDELLYNGQISEIDSSQISSKEVHEVNDNLDISSSSDYVPNTIFIERKTENDGLVEETIFKPLGIVNNNNNVSNRLPTQRTTWHTNTKKGSTTLVINKQVIKEISFISYKDAYLLNQFTGIEQLSNFSSSLSRITAIYLRVPKDLVIHTNGSVDLVYIDE